LVLQGAGPPVNAGYLIQQPDATGYSRTDIDRAGQVAADHDRTGEITGVHPVGRQVDNLSRVDVVASAQSQGGVLEDHRLADSARPAEQDEPVIQRITLEVIENR